MVQLLSVLMGWCFVAEKERFGVEGSQVEETTEDSDMGHENYVKIIEERNQCGDCRIKKCIYSGVNKEKEWRWWGQSA